jgi:hypothetical protein
LPLEGEDDVNRQFTVPAFRPLGTFATYKAGLHVDHEASLDAAVAAASRHVLVALIPTQRTLIDDAYTLSDCDYSLDYRLATVWIYDC